MNKWFSKKDDSKTNSSPKPLEQSTTNDLIEVRDNVGSESDQHVSLLRRAETAIAHAGSIEEVKDIRDKAAAARKYAESASLGLEAQNYAAEVKLRAERKAGELIAQMSLHGGDRRSNDSEQRVKLEDLGISKDQSSRWQLIARVPEKAFELHISSAKDTSGELTTSSVVQLARQLTPRKKTKPKMAEGGTIVTDLNELANRDEHFSCIYADPPWKYDNRATRATADKHYPTMTVDEICSLPIASLAAEHAHLHLWTTNGFLFEAPRVMRAWGFEYKSCLIWVKPQLGIGNYWRVSHEYLLLGVRGACKFRDKGVISWVRADRSRHSRKPDRVRKLVERVSHGPYLELFAREAAKGWVAYGNELSQ